MAQLPVYPPLLRRAHWKKHKGVVAEVAKGETGTGAKLDALEKKFDAVEWQYWFPFAGGNLARPKTPEQLEARILAGKYNQGQLNNLRAEIAKVRKHCYDLGSKWDRSKIVPAGTVQHVKVKMVAACDVLDQAVDDASEGDYTQVEADLQRQQAVVNQTVKAAMKVVKTNLPIVKATPTPAVYRQGLHNGVRGIGVVLARLPQFHDLYQNDWFDKVGDDYVEDDDDDDAILEKVAEIEAAYRRLKAALGA